MITALALSCFIVGVSDGDTLTARCGEQGAYEQVKIRLSAVDAPEKAQPFGTRSGQHLAELCMRVEATITPHTKDRYGRTVADVECRGQDVGAAQVAAGMAWYFTKYGRGYEQLARVEAQAREQKRGLWADPQPIAPWDWRQMRRAVNDHSPITP